jgi:hypothetical protein
VVQDVYCNTYLWYTTVTMKYYDDLDRKIDEIRKAGKRARAGKSPKEDTRKKCAQCGVISLGRRFCTPVCKELYAAEHSNELLAIDISNIATGAACIYTVAVDLTRRGYDVFIAAHSNTLCDLLSVNRLTGQVSRIQVRAGKLGQEDRVIAATRTPVPSGDILAAVDRHYITYTPELL